MQTAETRTEEFLTESCYHTHLRIKQANRSVILVSVSNIQANPSDIQANCNALH